MTALVDPVRIYVLWHQASRDGGELAREIFHWFRGNPEELHEAGYGIPIHYRSVPEQGGENVGFRPIQSSDASISVIVPLVDENMVTDGMWRRYLAALALEFEHIYPVTLHQAAYNLPEPLSLLNFIRVDHANDPVHWQWQERLNARRRRLRSLLTQACCRLLQTHGGFADDDAGKVHRHQGAGLPLRIFLSHAKADGVEITSKLRDRLLHHGQLQTFFDESDLAFGYGFDEPLRKNAGAGSGQTAAMIAVYSDAYAGRPWCQRELRMAREPFGFGEEPHQRWSNKPLLILDALASQRTRFLGEVGQAPVIRWDPSKVGDTIDLLLREVLLTLYYQHWSTQLKLSKGVHAFSGALDLHIALQIRRKARHTKGRNGERLRTILVPPPGPPTADRIWLQHLLGDVKIRTFDEYEKEKIWQQRAHNA